MKQICNSTILFIAILVYIAWNSTRGVTVHWIWYVGLVLAYLQAVCVDATKKL